MTLTYDQLFDALRREKSRDELQALEPGFYAQAHALLDGKEAEARQTQTLSAASQRAQIEYQNARRLLRELYDRRERKIVTLALHKTRTDTALIDTEALLPEEQAFFDSLVRLLLETRASFLHSIEEIAPRTPAPKPAVTKPPAPKEPEPRGVTITFLAAVPRFVGKDLTVFGPYEAGAAATLPEDVASILIKKGRAERSSTS